MTPEQALEILSQMAAQTHATLADHQAAQVALNVLKRAIQGPSEIEPKDGD